nr:hypothetical protein HJG63_010639 [Rousettus aegyptiacus]
MHSYSLLLTGVGRLGQVDSAFAFKGHGDFPTPPAPPAKRVPFVKSFNDTKSIQACEEGAAATVKLKSLFPSEPKKLKFPKPKQHKWYQLHEN